MPAALSQPQRTVASFPSGSQIAKTEIILVVLSAALGFPRRVDHDLLCDPMETGWDFP